MIDREELARRAVAVCDQEIEDETHPMDDLGGSVSYLAVTAAHIAIEEILKDKIYTKAEVDALVDKVDRRLTAHTKAPPKGPTRFR
jgi:hypothetical protein